MYHCCGSSRNAHVRLSSGDWANDDENVVYAQSDRTVLQSTSRVDTCQAMRIAVVNPIGAITEYVGGNDNDNTLKVQLKGGETIQFESWSYEEQAGFRMYWMRPYRPDPSNPDRLDPNDPINQEGTPQHACAFYIFNPNQPNSPTDPNTWIGGDATRRFQIPTNLKNVVRNDGNNGKIRVNINGRAQEIDCNQYPADYSRGVIFGANYIKNPYQWGGLWRRNIGPTPQDSSMFDGTTNLNRPCDRPNKCVVRTPFVVDTCASMTVSAAEAGKTITVNAGTQSGNNVIDHQFKGGETIIFDSSSTGDHAKFRVYWMRPYRPDPNDPVNQIGSREHVCSYYIFNPYTQEDALIHKIERRMIIGGETYRIFNLPTNLSSLARNDLGSTNGKIKINNVTHDCNGFTADYSKGVIFGVTYIENPYQWGGLWCSNAGPDVNNSTLFGGTYNYGVPCPKPNRCVVRTQYYSGSGDNGSVINPPAPVKPSPSVVISQKLQGNQNEIKLNDEVKVDVNVKNVGNVDIKDFTLYFESNTLEFTGVNYRGGVQVEYQSYTNKIRLPNLPPKGEQVYPDMPIPGEPPMLWNPYDGVLSAARDGKEGETMTLSLRLKVKATNSRGCIRIDQKVGYVGGTVIMPPQTNCLEINVRQSGPNPSLTISQDIFEGNGRFVVGDRIGYEVRIKNIGNVDIHSFTLSQEYNPEYLEFFTAKYEGAGNEFKTLNPTSSSINMPDQRQTLVWSDLPPLPPRPVSMRPDPREDGVLSADVNNGDGETLTIYMQFRIKKELPNPINNHENENCSILGGTIRYRDPVSGEIRPFALPQVRACTQFYLRGSSTPTPSSTSTPTPSSTFTPTPTPSSTPTPDSGFRVEVPRPSVVINGYTPFVYVGDEAKYATQIINEERDKVYKKIDFMSTYDSGKLVPKRIIIKHNQKGKFAVIDYIPNDGNILIKDIQDLCAGTTNLRAPTCDSSETLGPLSYNESYTINIIFGTQKTGSVCPYTTVMVVEGSQSASSGVEVCMFVDVPVLLNSESIQPLIPGLSTMVLSGAINLAIAGIRSRMGIP